MSRILIGNIKGPQGAQGIQGPQGPVGPQGPQGPMPELINNALATEAGVAALDAVMGKTLQDQINQTNDNNINVKVFSSNLSGLNANSYGSYTFDASDLNGKYIIGYIPVINYSGNRDLTCKIGSFSDLSAITVDVKNSEASSLNYGNIRLYILYK